METFGSSGGSSLLEGLPTSQYRTLAQLPEYEFTNMSQLANFTSGKTPFNKAGMGGILQAANWTLDGIFPRFDQFVNYTLDWEDLADLQKLDIPKRLTENKGPIAVFSLALLSALIITLIGLGWCCVRCCCRDKGCCSRKSAEEVRASKIAKKSDKYKRSVYGILFAAFVILFTFGLVSCFVTNEQIKDNVNKLPRELDNALVDSLEYINATIKQMEELFVKNYEKLEMFINDSVSKSGAIIKNGLAEQTGAQALNNLTDIVDTVENVWQSLKTVESTSKSLKSKADRLKSGLSTVKDRLIQLLENCRSPKCVELMNTSEIRSLRVQNDFENLPNMTEVLRELGNFFDTNVRKSIDRGRQAFDTLSIRIQAEVDPHKAAIFHAARETGRELSAISANVTEALREPDIQGSRKQIGEYEAEFKKYSPYWYYAVLLICCALTFIFGLMAFGIFVGFCGKQPGSEYSNECCSRKTGSSFINCGIFSIFISFLVFTVIALIHFILAGVGGQILCEAINSLDARTETAFKTAVKNANMNFELNIRIPEIRVSNGGDYQVPPISDILKSCRDGESAYVAFALDQVFDISILDKLVEKIDPFTERLANQVNIPADSTEGIVFLTPETKEQMNRFANSKITRMPFDQFANQLSESITSVDLRDVIERLNTTLDDRDTGEMSNEVKTNIMNEIMYLETLQEKILTPMLKDVQSSVEHLRALAKDQKDLTSRIRNVAKAAEIAQNALHDTSVTRQVRKIARDLTDEIKVEIDKYGKFTSEKIRKEVGQCGPLYNAFNSTVASVCVNILSPVGGYWFALSFLLILFIPILIIGCSLAGLYSKYKVGGYESATYYSSAYGDGDTIPLSLSANNPRRHKRGRANEARYSNRFEDTSHKAWGSQMVFNNHHTPPASGEYERPPPYYYPGPAQS